MAFVIKSSAMVIHALFEIETIYEVLLIKFQYLTS
ncbi:hypothetical protein TorRG33x02_251170 [Trema orientale]|uniref:Uncharacterized protein n=1 Tax=Trema orientale TaxID=63057 RepID=A0A2P5DHD9_TREOI|nr:hypothetical protein TorRG33x02_251170 [Trema orientale]